MLFRKNRVNNCCCILMLKFILTDEIELFFLYLGNIALKSSISSGELRVLTKFNLTAHYVKSNV